MIAAGLCCHLNIFFLLKKKNVKKKRRKLIGEVSAFVNHQRPQSNLNSITLFKLMVGFEMS